MKKSLLFLSTFLALEISSAQAVDFLDQETALRSLATAPLNNPYELTTEEDARIKRILEGCGIGEDHDVSEMPEILKLLPRDLLKREKKANDWDLTYDRASLTASSIVRIEKMQVCLEKVLLTKCQQ